MGNSLSIDVISIIMSHINYVDVKACMIINHEIRQQIISAINRDCLHPFNLTVGKHMPLHPLAKVVTINTPWLSYFIRATIVRGDIASFNIAFGDIIKYNNNDSQIQIRDKIINIVQQIKHSEKSIKACIRIAKKFIRPLDVFPLNFLQMLTTRQAKIFIHKMFPRSKCECATDKKSFNFVIKSKTWHNYHDKCAYRHTKLRNMVVEVLDKDVMYDVIRFTSIGYFLILSYNLLINGVIMHHTPPDIIIAIIKRLNTLNIHKRLIVDLTRETVDHVFDHIAQIMDKKHFRRCKLLKHVTCNKQAFNIISRMQLFYSEKTVAYAIKIIRARFANYLSDFDREHANIKEFDQFVAGLTQKSF